MPQALGRAGARLRPPLLPPRRREDGGLLRDATSRSASRDLAQRGGRDGFTAFKSMAVPPTMPLEGLAPDAVRRGVRRGDARRGRRRRSTSWSTATPGRARAWACSSPGARAVRPLLPRGAVLARARRRHRRDPAVGDDADRDRRAPRRRRTAFRELFEKGACSVLQPDITHCGGLTEARRIAALAEAYRVALAPHNPQGPVSTAASLEFGFATPCYVICETVTPTCPGAPTWSRSRTRSTRTGMRATRATRPGLGIEINEDDVESTRSSRRCRSGSSTPTAASATGSPIHGEPSHVDAASLRQSALAAR